MRVVLKKKMMNLYLRSTRGCKHNHRPLNRSRTHAQTALWRIKKKQTVLTHACSHNRSAHRLIFFGRFPNFGSFSRPSSFENWCVCGEKNKTVLRGWVNPMASRAHNEKSCKKKNVLLYFRRFWVKVAPRHYSENISDENCYLHIYRSSMHASLFFFNNNNTTYMWSLWGAYEKQWYAAIYWKARMTHYSNDFLGSLRRPPAIFSKYFSPNNAKRERYIYIYIVGRFGVREIAPPFQKHI